MDKVAAARARPFADLRRSEGRPGPPKRVRAAPGGFGRPRRAPSGCVGGAGVPRGARIALCGVPGPDRFQGRSPWAASAWGDVGGPGAHVAPEGLARRTPRPGRGECPGGLLAIIPIYSGRAVWYNGGMAKMKPVSVTASTRAIVRRPPEPLALDLTPEDRLVAAFLAGRRKATLRAYRQDLDDFRQFLGAASVAGVAAELLGSQPGAANETVLRYRAHLIDRGLAPATVNRRLAAIRSLVKLARTLGMVAWHLEVPGVRAEPYRDTRGPGVGGFEALMKAARGRRPKAIRDRAILRLLYDLALRRGELCALSLHDVDVKAATIAVVAKGRWGASILTLPGQTVAALRQWLRARRLTPAANRAEDPGGRPLFVGLNKAGNGHGRLTGSAIYEIVRTYGRLAGLPGKVRPHGLRHAAITAAIKLGRADGMDVDEVRDYSRHKDVTTLMLYRDRDRNVQGRLASLVAAKAQTGRPKRLPERRGKDGAK